MEVKKERGWGTASPFSLSGFSPPPLPSPPLFLHLPRRVYGDVLSVQTVKKCNMVVRDFWNRSFSRTEFSDLSMSNSDIFFRFHWQRFLPFKPDILTQTHGPREKKADCLTGQTLSVYCIGRQYLTLTVIVQLFQLTKGLNSLLVSCFSWPSGRQLKK